RRHGREVERPEDLEGEEHRDQEADVADAVDDEGLPGGVGVLPVLVPEADEEERADADALPPHEHQREAVGEHEHEHRGHEEVELGEVAGVARVAPHVADRVDVDQEADAGDDQRHHEAELVDQEPEVDGEAPRAQELGEHEAEAVRLARVGDERDQRQHEAHRQAGCRDHAASGLADAAPERAVDERAGQGDEGRQRDELDGAGGRLGHARTSASWSTSVVTRWRKIATRMPRPTATSAAATARTMNTAPCPSSAWPPPVTVHWRAYATMARLAALSISSIERKTRIALRRVTTPTAPRPNSTALRATKYSLGTLTPAHPPSGPARLGRRRGGPRRRAPRPGAARG